MTAPDSIAAALAQLELALSALDVREQQRRGYESHVAVPTDAEIAKMIGNAVGLLGGGCK